MYIKWSRQAEIDHEAIVEYIFEENPFAAIEVGDRIREAVNILTSFPELGKLGVSVGTRELVMPRDRCLAIYEITDEWIVILRVVHGGQERSTI